MKRKISISVLVIVLIFSLSIVVLAEEDENKYPMTKEEFFDTFNLEEIGAWKTAKNFIADNELPYKDYTFIEEYILPVNESYIKKLDDKIYEVYIKYEFNETSDWSGGSAFVTVERISDIKWILIDYSSSNNLDLDI